MYADRDGDVLVFAREEGGELNLLENAYSKSLVDKIEVWSCVCVCGFVWFGFLLVCLGLGCLGLVCFVLVWFGLGWVGLGRVG